MKKTLAIVDYGMGNLNSVKKKLDRLKTTASITSNPKDIIKADKIILVGVGHFAKAMKNIKELNLLDTLNEVAIIKKKPVLGICLGMQLMANDSEEGNSEGLGWLDANVRKMQVDDTLRFKIPHTGWNKITQSKKSHLMKGIPESSEFYFVHSYHLMSNETSNILNETEYCFKFTSAIEKNNIFGVQYHPEKSHDIGEVLLKNFISL
jgi:glutamine amidotransferase|tara:strand:+ start:72 stop:692 length:621 start_codon:yes stop_codon:yes gene_type:complete